jgi:hypothetical protein
MSFGSPLRHASTSEPSSAGWIVESNEKPTEKKDTRKWSARSTTSLRTFTRSMSGTRSA